MPERFSSRDRARFAREDDPPANEDFLFHLSRGSELLVQNRVIEAKEELENALSHQPQDAQGKDLLAGVYFRLGVYPSAIRLWKELIAEFPEDAVLRVNVALAYFKTGQPDHSREQLEQALSLDPAHERAWGYLGLTLWRLGRLDAAREAFLRGGQASMARRMEEESSASSPPPNAEPARSDAEGAVTLSLANERPERASGSWKVADVSAEPIASSPPPRSTTAIAPPSLSTLARSWAVELPEDSSLAIGKEGELLVSAQSAVYSRSSGVSAVRGPLRTESVQRRLRGSLSEGPLGGSTDPILRWHGPVAAIVAAPEGMRYHALFIDDSLLYVREELVYAFDDRVQFENGRLPLAGEPAMLVSFQGEGTVVLRLRRRPSGLAVGPGEEVHVDPNALVGWTGRLFPSKLADPNPPSAPLAFRGQGIVLVT